MILHKHLVKKNKSSFENKCSLTNSTYQSLTWASFNSATSRARFWTISSNPSVVLGVEDVWTPMTRSPSPPIPLQKKAENTTILAYPWSNDTATIAVFVSQTKLGLTSFLCFLFSLPFCPHPHNVSLYFSLYNIFTRCTRDLSSVKRVFSSRSPSSTPRWNYHCFFKWEIATSFIWAIIGVSVSLRVALESFGCV